MLGAVLGPLLAAGTATAGGQSCVPADTASYDVHFDAVWSEATHPDSFPPFPHFSGLLTASHNAELTLWAEGELASQGIELMAEGGNRSILTNDVEAAIDAGTAFDLVLGGGVGVSPGAVTTNISLDRDHTLVSLTTMVAPSPDWFTGVSGLDLFVDGNWVDMLVVEARPYDSGTDSGVDYTSPNADTQPPQPIFEITGAPFHNGVEVPALGTLTFTRTTATCVDNDGDDIDDAVDNCAEVANPDQRDTNGDGIGNACDADLDNDCNVAFGDLALFKAAFFPAEYVADADFDGDGLVNFGDLALLKSTFHSGAMPGPGPGAPGNACE